MELIPGPELDRSLAEWKTIRGDDQTRVHQNSAGRVVATLAATGIWRSQFLQYADRFRIVTMVRELSRIVKHQHRRVYRGGKALPRAEKMTGKDLLLINPYVRKETISCPTKLRNLFP